MRSKNPTLLTLLKAGCEVVFPSGYRLLGDPEAGYIDTENEFGHDGLRILDRDGVQLALGDEKRYVHEQETARKGV